MNTLKYDDLTFVYNCKILPPKGYSAINLFGYIFTRKNYEDLIEYLSTDRGKIWVHHEAMHSYQADTFKPKFIKWILFYIVYLVEFFKAWPFFMSWRQAYRTICFELEAYDKQNKIYIHSSNYKTYMYSNKVRKEMKV